MTLLPVELILQVGSGAGYAMIFALLIAAIVWNLGTWALGLPNSSSHALIGSVIGVGLANQLMAPNHAASGVAWGQAASVLESLLFSPSSASSAPPGSSSCSSAWCAGPTSTGPRRARRRRPCGSAAS